MWKTCRSRSSSDQLDEDDASQLMLQLFDQCGEMNSAALTKRDVVQFLCRFFAQSTHTPRYLHTQVLGSNKRWVLGNSQKKVVVFSTFENSASVTWAIKGAVPTAKVNVTVEQHQWMPDGTIISANIWSGKVRGKNQSARAGRIVPPRCRIVIRANNKKRTMFQLRIEASCMPTDVDYGWNSNNANNVGEEDDDAIASLKRTNKGKKGGGNGAEKKNLALNGNGANGSSKKKGVQGGSPTEYLMLLCAVTAFVSFMVFLFRLLSTPSDLPAVNIL